jgi:hypothetical protein
MAHGENPCFPNFLENHLELGAKVAMMRLTTVAKLKSRPAGRAGPPMAFLYAMGNILQYSRNCQWRLPEMSFPSLAYIIPKPSMQ